MTIDHSECDGALIAALSVPLEDKFSESIFYRLVHCFSSGYPLEKLRTLLTSENDEVRYFALDLLWEVAEDVKIFESELRRIAENDDDANRELALRLIKR